MVMAGGGDISRNNLKKDQCSNMKFLEHLLFIYLCSLEYFLFLFHET